MELEVHPDALAVCRLEPSADVPSWATDAPGALVSATWTTHELSVVAPERVVPADVRAERGWRAISVAGPLDFSLTGILAELSRVLADAGVPIFVLSTFDTDWVLVRDAQLAQATEALSDAGHRVSR